MIATKSTTNKKAFSFVVLFALIIMCTLRDHGKEFLEAKTMALVNEKLPQVQKKYIYKDSVDLWGLITGQHE